MVSYFEDKSLTIIEICNQIFYSDIDLFIKIEKWIPFYENLNKFFDIMTIKKIKRDILLKGTEENLIDIEKVHHYD